MIIISGAPALSAFRQRKLLVNLKQAVPSITDVKAEYQHFADISKPLSSDDTNTLKALLQYGPMEQPFTALLAQPASYNSNCSPSTPGSVFSGHNFASAV